MTPQQLSIERAPPDQHGLRLCVRAQEAPGRQYGCGRHGECKAGALTRYNKTMTATLPVQLQQGHRSRGERPALVLVKPIEITIPAHKKSKKKPINWNQELRRRFVGQGVARKIAVQVRHMTMGHRSASASENGSYATDVVAAQRSGYVAEYRRQRLSQAKQARWQQIQSNTIVLPANTRVRSISSISVLERLMRRQ